MKKTCFISEQQKTGVICVDSYEEKQIKGRVTYKDGLGQRSFSSLTQLLEAISSALERLGYPGEYSSPRSFAVWPAKPEPEPTLEIDQDPEDGALATFYIKIIFLQHATWQGTLRWKEGRREINFRSALEMIMLMNQALTNNELDMRGAL